MFDFNPFITNDGSVGLYSREDNDIYHSVYGALSESWEKFILPANLNYYLEKYNDLRFLDICYGIGYNSKSLIQFLINYTEGNSIYTNNISQKDSINNETIYTDNATIYTDNAKHNFGKSLSKKFCNFVSNNFNNNKNTKSIYSDNVNHKICIDSVDLNEKLILLSPFIRNKFNYKNLLEIDLPEIKKLKSKNIKPYKLKSEYLISDDVQKILLREILKNGEPDFEFLDDMFKKYSGYFSKDMRSLIKFYKKSACNLSSEHAKRTFLHNIYYRYISYRYFKGVKTPYDNIFDVNVVSSNAIDFVSASDKIYNLIFLDGFTPAKCPKLWTIDFFMLLNKHLSDDGSILTYSNSSQVRNAFLNSGFYVGKIYSQTSGKFIGTIASKNKSLIKHELSEYDLGLLKTKAGIFYRDENFRLTNEQIIEAHKIEVESSDLLSSSKYIKLNSK